MPLKKWQKFQALAVSAMRIYAELVLKVYWFDASMTHQLIEISFFEVRNSK